MYFIYIIIFYILNTGWPDTKVYVLFRNMHALAFRKAMDEESLFMSVLQHQITVPTSVQRSALDILAHPP
jgi:hypothetical protein